MIFLLQSFLVGGPHYAARGLSTDGLKRHPLIKELYSKYKVLHSESVADVDMAVFEDARQTWTYKGMRGLVDGVLRSDKFSEDFKGKLITLLHG